MSKTDFDAVVVGSGFGGSVTAYHFRKAGKRVCLLERGRRYGPGDFPRSPDAVARNFWDPSKQLYGMFDIWTFDHVEAVVSSALGGGSIIYANVLLEKPPGSFAGWPLTHAQLASHYQAVRDVIGVQRYPFGVAPYDETPKTRAFAQAAASLHLQRELPPLAVTFANDGRPAALAEPIAGSSERYTCRLCGECNVGCNYGSKNTLDFNYLDLFENEHGGEVRPLCEVKSFGPLDGGGFQVKYDRHDPKTGGRERLSVTAERLVLAAGSLGSTYLLLRNAENFPSLDRRLVGTRWCGNGDLLGFLKNADVELEPSRGPVITTALCYENGRYYIEDGGYPAWAEWFVEGTHTLSLVRRFLRFASRYVVNRLFARPVSNISGEVAALFGTGSSRALPLLGMGDDVPDGRLYLKGRWLQNVKGRWLQNDWSEASSDAYYQTVRASMQELAGALGADFAPELLWYFKKLITAHPVGGCPMGATAAEGIVDQYGQVFGVPRLSIADGSILPGPVGPNPSLTIAAIADRAAEATLANW